MSGVSIIGSGKMAGALAFALAKAGRPADNIFFIHKIPEWADHVSLGGAKVRPFDEWQDSRCEIVLIAVGDPFIALIAAKLIEKRIGMQTVLHVSGSLSSEVLAPLASTGTAIGSMHPLTSVSDSLTGAGNFAGAFFCIEGTGPALERAEMIAELLGGRPFTIETKFKSLYHAAAVMASGNVVALFDMARQILSACGPDENTAGSILLPLLRSTVANLERQSPAEALTGPFARADPETVVRHLSAFSDSAGSIASEIMKTYLMLGGRSIELAEAAGADPEGVDRVRKEISIAKKKLRC